MFGQIVILQLATYAQDLKVAPIWQVLPPLKSITPPAQRKTTLKWARDGELSAIDMARILDRLSNPELTQCDLL